MYLNCSAQKSYLNLSIDTNALAICCQDRITGVQYTVTEW